MIVRYDVPTRILLLTVAVVAGSLSCHSERDAPAEAAHDDPHHEHDAEAHDTHQESAGLDLHDVRGVTFAPAGAEREEGAWVAAEAISDATAVATASTTLTGTVDAILVAPGAVVRRGAALVQIRSPEQHALKAQLDQALVAQRQAQQSVERERRLFARQATSARELELAESEARATTLAYEAARAALELRGIDPDATAARSVLRSPVDGTLERYLVHVGQAVDAGTEIAQIVATGAARVRVELQLPGPQDWNVGAQTKVRRSDGLVWNAVVEGVPAAVDPVSRRVSYLLRLEGKELPLAGTPLEVRIPLARAVVLPQDSLQQIEGVWGVFVRDNEFARFQPVRKGPELGGEVMVLEGVAPGDPIATDGAYLLKALWLKRSGAGDDHGH
jgi:cobalt-zinc-cadmium efflux system membrane fusion protein